MTPTRQRTIPGAPKRQSLAPLPLDDIQDEPAIDGALLQGLAIADDRLANGRIERSVLDAVRLIGADASSLLVRACDLQRCDLSGATMEAASLIRCRIDGCKLTGSTLDRAILRDTVFMECRADLLRLQHAQLEHVRFERCQLRSAFFNGASMPKTVFEECDLTDADFSGADISDSDLRRSRIEGIRIAPDQLRGVIVSHDQALYLAGLLGLVIRDD